MKNKKPIEKVVKKIVNDYSRVLIGLAHYDEGKKVKGCDCCYCIQKSLAE